MVFAILIIWAVPAAAQDTPLPRFEPGPCPVNFPPQYTVNCGKVIVPERHSQPEGPTIELAVAVFKAASSAPNPDPVIHLDGGPGQRTLLIQQTGPYNYLEPLLKTRDVIIFDMRGIGFSQPSLECPEFRDVRDINPYAPAYLDAARQCHDRLIAAGIDFSAFNSVENAADVADVAQALGYDQVNLVGGSYGSFAGLSVVRDHASILRSVALHAINNPPEDLIGQWYVNYERSLYAVFAACEADAICHGAFPHLSAVYFNLIERLNASPMLLTINDPTTGTSVDFELSGDLIVTAVQRLLYRSDLIPMLPGLLYALDAGQIPPSVQELLGAGLQDAVTIGAHFAYSCHDEFLSITPESCDAAIAGLHPTTQKVARQYYSAQSAVCGLIAADPPAAFELAPISSDVPVLLLSGEFDPVTPPAFAEHALQTLSHGQAFTLRGLAHSPGGDTCAQSLIWQFIDNPEWELITTCLDRLPRLSFVIP
jgi:pimeloyl-ACP methyl ester carboxylesterase